MKKKILLAAAAVAALTLSGCGATTTNDTAKSIAKTADSPTASASSTKSAKPAKPKSKGPSAAEKKWARYTHMRAPFVSADESVIGEDRSQYNNVCKMNKEAAVSVIAEDDFKSQTPERADVMAFVTVYCPKQKSAWRSAFRAHLMTAGEYNAVRSAKEYLDTGAYSKAGLADQLHSKYGEGFTREQAQYAVNHVKVNWNKQATKSAKEYLDSGGFSRSGLIDQLESEYGEQFTHAQAVYGVSHAGL